MQKGEFLFQKNFYEICQEIQAPLLRVAVYDTICEYGVTEKSRLSEYPITESQRQLIQTIVEPIFFAMKSKKKQNQDGDFLFRKNFYEICQEIQEPLLRLAFYDIICEYGVLGKSSLSKYPITEAERKLIRAIVNPIFSSINGTKKRYQKAVENGRKGGLMGGRGNKKKTAENEAVKKRRQ